jgi:hemerythrin
MFMDWRDEMATGNDEIDAQHRDLLRKVHDLLTACRHCRGEEEIARLLWFLKRYVRKHFRDEEQVQLSSGYPGYPEHKLQHAAFYREVRQLEEQYRQNGANSMLIVRAVQTMCSWLRDHYQRFDGDLVEYLRNTASAEKP